MRKITLLLVGLMTLLPVAASAETFNPPGNVAWYFHVDLKEMRSSGAGHGVYGWLVEEVFSEIKEESGIDLEKELDRMTSYSSEEQGHVVMFEGDISQASKDLVMTLVAVEGDLQPRKSSGKSYYHFAGNDRGDDEATYGRGDIKIKIKTLSDEAWVSMDLKGKILITSSEEQMLGILADNGKIAGASKKGGALVVLTAEKTLLQAGMNTDAVDDDGDSSWESNILRNTEQVAFLVAAAKGQLVIETKLVTTEPDMAESLASVARGLISLASFSDDMDDNAVAMLRNTRVKANGNNLSISLVVDPEVVVATLRD